MEVFLNFIAVICTVSPGFTAAPWDIHHAMQHGIVEGLIHVHDEALFAVGQRTHGVRIFAVDETDERQFRGLIHWAGFVRSVAYVVNFALRLAHCVTDYLPASRQAKAAIDARD